MNLKEPFIFLTIICTSIISLEAVLNFEDENFFGFEADRIDWSGHPCHRKCVDGGEPMICEYVFVVEEFSAMSKACYDCPFNLTDCRRPHCIPVDGVQKTLFVANRQMPGPSVEVCKDDTVVVEVRNMMMSQSTAIHWHGIDQKGTPYMDGVPYVTQCPILPNDRFRYAFNVTISGTYFWHSHIGNQRADGLFGSLIVRDTPRRNPHAKLYDFDEHTMMVNDWMHLHADIGFLRDLHYMSKVVPSAIIVNGKGRFEPFVAENGTKHFTPLEVFTVTQGSRYRFRMIASGAEDCPIEMAIDNHTMRIISLDSNDIEPVDVDTLHVYQGERVDFIINANQSIGNYWIRFRGFGLCAMDENTTIYQTAILRYRGAEIADPTRPVGYNIMSPIQMPRSLNPDTVEPETRRPVTIPSLNSLAHNDLANTREPDQQIFMSFDYYPLDSYDYHRKGLYGRSQVLPQSRMGILQINNITLHMQPFPLLSQRDQIKPSMLCNYTTIKDKSCVKNGQCTCTHVINVKLNSVAELVFIDQGLVGDINHPLHLHGHFFRVVATENLDGIVTVDRIKQLDKEGKIKRKLNRAPIKDTMKTPGGGYTIVRFYADNPGYWFFHCHFEQHVNIGMALVIKVGEHEDMAPVPKDFLKCGTFKT